MGRLGFFEFLHSYFVEFLIKLFLLPCAHFQNDLLIGFIKWVLLPSLVVEEAEQE